MCKHQWVKVNDVYVCKKCGMTRTPDGKIMFDRDATNICKKRRKKNGKT